MGTNISVVLPALNEAENISVAVERALAVLADLADEYEVIVVDDGSTDDTRAIVEELMSSHYPRVRLAVHPVNRGYGAALRTGFSLTPLRPRLLHRRRQPVRPRRPQALPAADRGVRPDRRLPRLPLRHDAAVVPLLDLQPDRQRPLPGSRARRRLRLQALPPRGPARRSRSSATTSSSTPSSSRRRGAGTSACSRRASATTRGWRARPPCSPPHITRTLQADRD